MSAALDEAIGKITFCLGETIKCLANRLGTLQYQILRIEQALNACNQDSVFLASDNSSEAPKPSGQQHAIPRLNAESDSYLDRHGDLSYGRDCCGGHWWILYERYGAIPYLYLW
jgi:hypothetical protein